VSTRDATVAADVRQGGTAVDPFVRNGGGVTLPELHDLTHAPTALYQLNGSLVDTSGNGRAALTVINGVERYRLGNLDSNTRRRCVYGASGNATIPFDGGACYGLSIADSAWARAITGALTLEVLAWFDCFSPDAGAPSGEYPMVTCGNFIVGGNLVYELSIAGSDFADADRNKLFYTVISAGAGARVFSTRSILPGRWNHLALTRNMAGSSVSFYINGQPAGTSAVAVTPTLFATNQFFVAGLNAAGVELVPYDFLGGLSSVKVMSSELTAANILSEAHRTLGGLGYAP
jgi:hypothetical protein